MSNLTAWSQASASQAKRPHLLNGGPAGTSSREAGEHVEHMRRDGVVRPDARRRLNLSLEAEAPERIGQVLSDTRMLGAAARPRGLRIARTCSIARSAENTVAGAIAASGFGGRLDWTTRAAQRRSSANA